MLREFLAGGNSNQIRWSDSMPGVEICRFALSNLGGEELLTIPVMGAPFQFETFFCLEGRLIADTAQSGPVLAEAGNVFLLSDTSGLCRCSISGNLRGILVAVDGKAARSSLSCICSAMGLIMDTRVVRQKMEARRGWAVLSNSPWTQALFESMARLPARACDRYCVFKAVELLYLLCAKEPATEQGLDPHPPGYVAQSILAAKRYMEVHLDEKLTIDSLSHLFSVSPTFLKTEFRRMYGQPIHSWLIRRRMTRARDLLCSTDLSIQQIAQAVGYDGISQFHAVFKRYYDTTPGQFRKMSKAAAMCPFP